jgi:hypothetical protein
VWPELVVPEQQDKVILVAMAYLELAAVGGLEVEQALLQTAQRLVPEYQTVFEKIQPSYIQQAVQLLVLMLKLQQPVLQPTPAMAVADALAQQQEHLLVEMADPASSSSAIHFKEHDPMATRIHMGHRPRHHSPRVARPHRPLPPPRMGPQHTGGIHCIPSL